MNIICKVNEDNITLEAFNSAYARYLVQQEEEQEDLDLTPENIRYFKSEVLNFLVERMLLLQEAQKRESITISDEMIDERIQEFKQNFETLEDFTANCEMLGVKEADLVNEIRCDLMIEALTKELFAELTNITEDTLKDYFEANKSRMKEPDFFSFYEVQLFSKDQLEIVAKILKEDLSFEKLQEKIKALSCTINHYKDVEASTIPPTLLNVIADLKEGQMGTMVLEEDRYLLIKLLSKKIGKHLVFDEIKQGLKEYFVKVKQKELLDQIIEKAFADANIKYINMAPLEEI